MTEAEIGQFWRATGPAGLSEFEFVDAPIPAPQRGEVTIDVVSAGINPADLKHARAATEFPLPIGYEVSGRLAAVGPETEIATGPASVGEAVLAFRVRGGYATKITVPARDVFHKPASLGFDEAAGLLLAGSTAADMLRAANVRAGDLILLNGASGAVGVMVLQLARDRGISVIGTARETSFQRARQFGGRPVTYGDGLADRVRAIANGARIDAALDAVGTDEAMDVSEELVVDRSRIVTIAAPVRAAADGCRALAGRQADSAAYRDSVRGDLIGRAGAGELVVPIAATFPLASAPEALELVVTGRAGGKVILRAHSDR